MKKNTSILFLFLIITSNLLSQVTEEWVARYNGPSNSSESAYAIAVDKSGNSYVTGTSYSFSPRSNVVTIKYNSDGVQQWIAVYNSPIDSSDFGWSIAVDDTGNVYVAAESYGVGSNRDYTTIKYNDSGVEQWVVRYNGPGNSIDVPEKLVLDNLGFVYVVGYSFGAMSEIAAVKYNSAGTFQWVARYSDTNSYDEYGRSICVDNQGNVFVTGDVFTTLMYDDYITIKYNSNGVCQWVALYNGTANKNDQAFSIKVRNGGVYVTGRSEGINTSFDVVTLRYNQNGQLLWEKRYDGINHGHDNAFDIDFDYWGNIFVSGTEGLYSPPSRILTLKYDTSGVQKWVSRFDAFRSDRANSMKVDSAGNVYVAGSITGSNSLRDFITFKLNGQGLQQWTITYDGPANSNDIVRALDINNSGNVWVTGVSVGIYGPGADYCTIRYSQPVGIQPVSTEVPDNFSLSQNYPNPFNPITKIKFDTPPRTIGAFLSPKGREQWVKLVVYDILGREVSTLVNQQLNPGTYEVGWDASNYPSSVYFYRLIVTDASAPLSITFSETKKMVLQK